MTNPSYTDEQVKHLVNLCSTGPTQAALRHLDVAEALEFLLADRQRLQAEVEALRQDAERYRWIRNEADPDMDEPYITRHVCGEWGKWRNTWETGSTADECIDAARATPNETKEAKS